MKRRVSLVVALCLALVVGLCATAYANTRQTNWMECEGYFNSTSASDADGYALTYVYQVGRGAADNLITRVDIFKGGTWIKGDEKHVLNSWLGRASVSCFSYRSGNWELSGWHFADWEAGTLEDSCSTYDSASGRVPGLEFADEYREANDAVATWVPISYVDSSNPLKNLLGKEVGVKVDRLFHTTLAANLKEGDKIPVMLIAPDGSEVIALFFHEDGSTTQACIGILEGSPSIISTVTLVSEK